jgi:TRAP-type C4-dicarboxylate transport system substrate-binding protein
MKRILLSVLLALFLAVPGVAMAEEGQVYKLKLADSFPIGHPGNKLALGYIDQVKKMSKNRIEIEYYPAEQLGKMKDLLKLCQGGLTDIAYIAPSFYAGQLPLNTVMVLPFWTTALEGAQIYQGLLASSQELKDELGRYNVQPLSAFATAQYDVGTVKHPIDKPEDLKGLRLKSSGGIFEKMAQRYGIVPVTIASPEVYEATQRGVVDGNIFSLVSIEGYRINELEKYHTLGMRLGGFPSMYVINRDSLKKLPEDLQQALLGAAEQVAAVFAFFWDEQNQKKSLEFEQAGMTIRRIAPEERETWDAPLKGIEKEWIADMEGRGLPGQKVFDQFTAQVQAVMNEP